MVIWVRRNVGRVLDVWSRRTMRAIVAVAADEDGPIHSSTHLTTVRT